VQVPGTFRSTPIKRVQPTRRVGVAHASIKVVPLQVSVLLSMTSAQVGAALAKNLFHAIGPAGAVFLRVGFAALILLAVWRPQVSGYTWREYRWAVLFGGVLAAMNFSFYQSLDLSVAGPHSAGCCRHHRVYWTNRRRPAWITPPD
jgi:hypothetical protein